MIKPKKRYSPKVAYVWVSESYRVQYTPYDDLHVVKVLSGHTNRNEPFRYGATRYCGPREDRAMAEVRLWIPDAELPVPTRRWEHRTPD